MRESRRFKLRPSLSQYWWKWTCPWRWRSIHRNETKIVCGSSTTEINTFLYCAKHRLFLWWSKTVQADEQIMWMDIAQLLCILKACFTGIKNHQFQSCNQTEPLSDRSFQLMRTAEEHLSLLLSIFSLSARWHCGLSLVLNHLCSPGTQPIHSWAWSRVHLCISPSGPHQILIFLWVQSECGL